VGRTALERRILLTIPGYILEAINQVYNSTEQPQETLDEAAAKSAEALGW